MLQQNVGGHPVAVFRFPPRTKFAPNSTVTVFSGCNDHKLHNPPSDYVWKEQQKWGTGPECTTILCRPNGQVKQCRPIQSLLNIELNAMYFCCVMKYQKNSFVRKMDVTYTVKTCSSSSSSSRFWGQPTGHVSLAN